MRTCVFAIGLLTFAPGASAQTDEAPMMLGQNGFSTTALLTVGEFVANIDGGMDYQMTGIPDGIAVAEDGAVWVANAHGGQVLGFAADGALIERFPVPMPMVTSLCFGGEDLRELYVVTGSRGAESERAGTVYRIRVEVPGLPLAPARVRLP